MKNACCFELHNHRGSGAEFNVHYVCIPCGGGAAAENDDDQRVMTLHSESVRMMMMKALFTIVTLIIANGTT